MSDSSKKYEPKGSGKNLRSLEDAMGDVSTPICFPTDEDEYEKSIHINIGNSRPAKAIRLKTTD